MTGFFFAPVAKYTKNLWHARVYFSDILPEGEENSGEVQQTYLNNWTEIVR